MTQIAQIHQTFNSLLSIEPLVAVLKKMVAESRPGARKLYEGLLHEIEAKPELLQPNDNLTPLIENSELVETLLSTIFPPSTTANEGLYAISFPFRHETIYASPGFRELFLTGEANLINLPDRETTVHINKALLNLAYNVILKKLYGLDVPAVASSIHLFTNSETGVSRYLELKLNAQFVEVKPIDPAFELPRFPLQRTLDMAELLKIIPLEAFQFLGLVVINVADVTGEQVIAELKNTLLTFNSTSDTSVYNELQGHIETLLELSGIRIGITPFFKMNELYLFSEGQYANSLLYKSDKAASQHERLIKLLQQTYRHANYPVLYQKLDENTDTNGFLKYYSGLGLKSLIICPLKDEEGHLIGLLELGSEDADALQFRHLSKLQPSMPLFSLALEKSIENLEFQINRTIKEHFTAIQPAVEWKFTETAFQFIKNRQANESAKMGAITFEDVYPLYAAIDIRNSSVERNNAIQLDIMEQLKCAHTVLSTAVKGISFPLLKEYLFKIDSFITATAEQLLSEEEMQIYDFLQQDLDALFKHLLTSHPELKKSIDGYFASLDPQRNLIYHHRKDYEESITKINDTLDRFMDGEQGAAQKVFPHYFERYITDGIEFNIYVGQALAPAHLFDEIYVKNLKLWQLTVLVKAARLTHGLEQKLPLPLQTTQLILAHSIPLTISFRRKERKFDVDGAYNIRYEIIKKRIDKVHLKDSEERLTQPGKIAVVYSQQKELNEYLEYIEYLKAEQLLTDSIEHLELEDTQGISGLKAVRVGVNLELGGPQPPKVELSKVTSRQLLSK
ncbi:MAG TPA: hypothetical protein VM010_02150 [Chitinophagaceae bacterium]|nr:hypothetical protein [Chitinophagaceae bacterium]